MILVDKRDLKIGDVILEIEHGGDKYIFLIVAEKSGDFEDLDTVKDIEENYILYSSSSESRKGHFDLFSSGSHLFLLNP